jgi:hypothetical protein
VKFRTVRILITERLAVSICIKSTDRYPLWCITCPLYTSMIEKEMHCCIKIIPIHARREGVVKLPLH